MRVRRGGQSEKEGLGWGGGAWVGLEKADGL